MSIIVFFIILFTIVQVIVCHFTFWWLLAVIARIIFSVRNFGIIVKTKYPIIMEGVAMATMFLFYLLFNKNSFPWARVGLNILLTLVVVAIELLDGMLYVYDTVDYEEEDIFEIK